MHKFEKIILPHVVDLGDHSLRNCKSLKSAIFSDNLKIIGKKVFEGWSNIKDLALGNGLTSVDEEALYGLGIFNNQDTEIPTAV